MGTIPYELVFPLNLMNADEYDFIYTLNGEPPPGVGIIYEAYDFAYELTDANTLGECFMVSNARVCTKYVKSHTNIILPSPRAIEGQ